MFNVKHKDLIMETNKIISRLWGVLSFLICTSGFSQTTTWQLNGNNNIDDACFLGTTNNSGLAFRTNSQSRLVISADGRIGIGTSTPGVQLDVTSGTIAIRSLTGSDTRFLFVTPEGEITSSGILAPDDESWDEGDCGLRLDGWGKCSMFGNELSLNPIYDKVRLGEIEADFPAPSNMRLDLRGGLKVEGEVKINGWGMKPTLDNELEFTFMGFERMQISQEGNLCINPITPPNPAVKLQVEAHPTHSSVALCALSDYDSDWKYNIKSVIHRDNTKALAVVDMRSEEDVFRVWGSGLVEAKHIKIHQDGWADYVFDEGYSLPPLDELGAFIQEHHHLPGIPSEQEIIEHGADVGEMQVKLLEKIEELTLYMIDLKRENEALREMILNN